MTFTDDLTDVTEPVWETILEHPMIRELGEGILAEGPFRYWVRQDYVYLIEYARVFALGASSEEFTELTDWCKDLMDDVAADATGTERERFRELFLTSARYEYLFWDAAWNAEEWPVGHVSAATHDGGA
jgi:thiaminase